MALLKRNQTTGGLTMPCGSTELTAHTIAKLSSSTLVVCTASTEPTALFVTLETGAANGQVACARIGDIVDILAHDADISEGERVCPAALGRIDSVGTLTTATQYTIGIALQASSAAAQKISVLYFPEVLTKAAG